MVKCVDCGYLGVREIDNQRLVNPGAEQRKSGQPPGNFNGVAITLVEPICTVAAFDLEAEVSGPGPAPAAKVMDKDRECEQFTEWVPALTPKEHLDMNLLERQRDWQRQCEKEDREWREKCSREDKKWREEQARLAQEQHRETLEQGRLANRRQLWVLGGFVGVCTLIAGVCGIVAALFSRQ